MLMKMADNADARVSLPAMALLGTLKLQQGATQQGFNLLHRALEVEQGATWFGCAPGRGRSWPGLSSVRPENAGLNRLHNAQQAFQSAGQTDQLAQCLENEAGYLEQAKKSDLAKAIRDRLAAM